LASQKSTKRTHIRTTVITTACGGPIDDTDRASSSGPVVLFTMESLRTIEETAWVRSRTAMDHPTRESGRTTRNRARAPSNGSVELIIQEISVMIRCMEMEYLRGSLGLNMKANGDITKRMAKGKCNTRMAVSTKVLGKTTSVMEKDTCDGKMERHMKVNSWKMLSTVVAFTLGPTNAFMKEIGIWASAQAQGKLHILMALNTMADSKTT